MSWWSENKEEEEEEDEDELRESDFNSLTDRLIFLIDGRRAMRETLVDKGPGLGKGESHLQNALRFALSVMKSKVIAADNSSIGVVFFGTREKTGADGIYTLLPLAPPSASRIQQLEARVSSMDFFDREVGSSADPPPLKSALWACSQLFDADANTKAKKASSYSRLWLFTNDDTPLAGQPGQVEQLMQVGRDLSKKVEISLWSLDPSPDRPFNINKFYKQLLEASSADSGEGDEDEDDNDNAETTREEALAMRTTSGGSTGFDMNLAAVRRKQYRKRILTRMTWSLGRGLSDQDVSFAVKVYKTIHVAKRPSHAAWLRADTNAELQSNTRYIDSARGNALETAEISTYFEAGPGVQIPIKKEDFSKVRSMGHLALNSNTASDASTDKAKASSGGKIQTLFFTSMAQLRPSMGLNDGCAYFLFPDEASVTGSMELFSMLVDRLSEKGLAAIVTFTRSRSVASVPLLAAIFAEREWGVEDGSWGLYMLPLPYAEDIRRSAAGSASAVKSEGDNSGVQALLAKAVASMQCDEDFDYTREIENPALQLYYSTLQAVALSDPQPTWDASKDNLVMPPRFAETEGFESWAQVQEAMQLREEDLATVGSKKKRGGDDGAPSRKAAKSDAPKEEGALSMKDVQDLIKSNQISKQTVAQLKDICRGFELPVSGTKDLLITRILEHCK